MVRPVIRRDQSPSIFVSCEMRKEEEETKKKQKTFFCGLEN